MGDASAAGGQHAYTGIDPANSLETGVFKGMVAAYMRGWLAAIEEARGWEAVRRVLKDNWSYEALARSGQDLFQPLADECSKIGYTAGIAQCYADPGPLRLPTDLSWLSGNLKLRWRRIVAEAVGKSRHDQMHDRYLGGFDRGADGGSPGR